MNIHKNARLTFARRLEMVQDVLDRKLRPTVAAARHDVSVPTLRKWVGRYLVQGEPGLRDASSRPRVSPRATAPHIALAIVELASWTRYIRGQMLEVIRQDYIRTARAKGLKDRVVIFRHALRNALLPLITLFGLAIPSFFSGALIVETIFSWPGIGRLTYDAATSRNYTVIMGTVLMSSTLVIMGNLLADIGYSLLDPRIKQG